MTHHLKKRARGIRKRNLGVNSKYTSRPTFTKDNSLILRSHSQDMAITSAIDLENKKLAKQVDLIFTAKKDGEDHHSDTDFKKAFLDIDSKIRHLNAELRRIMQKEEYEPTHIQTDICNSFDGIKNELVPFKIP